MIRNEVVEAYNKDKDLKDLRVYNGKYIQYRETYIRNKLKGDYTIIIEEWDDFQRERELKEALEFADKKTKGEIIMSERKVRVQLSRDYQVAEVEVSGILDRNDFLIEKEWALSECKRLLNEATNKPNVQPKVVKPVEYVKVQEQSKVPSNGVYTLAHITTKFLKGKQFDIALKGLNAGKINLDQLNASQSWQDAQALVFPPR
jgi:hypothetical protein